MCRPAHCPAVPQRPWRAGACQSCGRVWGGQHSFGRSLCWGDGAPSFQGTGTAGAACSQPAPAVVATRAPLGAAQAPLPAWASRASGSCTHDEPTRAEHPTTALTRAPLGGARARPAWGTAARTGCAHAPPARRHRRARPPRRACTGGVQGVGAGGGVQGLVVRGRT